MKYSKELVTRSIEIVKQVKEAVQISNSGQKKSGCLLKNMIILSSRFKKEFLSSNFKYKNFLLIYQIK